MKKMQGDGDLETCLSRFLFNYRTTPHTTTDVSPAELLMNLKLRSSLDLLSPSVKDKVQEKQFDQIVTMIYIPVNVTCV